MRKQYNAFIFMVFLFAMFCAIAGCALARPVLAFPDSGMYTGFSRLSDTAGEFARAVDEAMGYPLVIADQFTGYADYVIHSDHIYFFSVEIGEGYSGFHYLREDGRELATDDYDKGYPFHEGLACVCRDGKYGFINDEGEAVIPFEFDDAAPFMEGLAYYATPQEYGFMDTAGIPVFTLDCDSVSSFQEGLAFFFQDGRYGYLDQTGTVVIPPAYDYAEYFEEGLALVGEAGKLGVIDKSGKVIVPLLYDDIERCGDYIQGELNEDTVCYDRNGQICGTEAFEKAREAEKSSFYYYSRNSVPSELYQDFRRRKLEELEASSGYDAVFMDGACFKVKKDGKYGYLNLNGDLIVPVEYDYVKEDVDYNGENIRVMTRWDGGEDLLVCTGQGEPSERKEALLKNAITPKRPALWEKYLQEDYRQCINNSRYFMLDNFTEETGELLLYQGVSLHTPAPFPWSESAFYREKDGKAELLISGYECGGSMRGDWVHLWYDQENGRILLGKTGSAGGFGGYAHYDSAYELRKEGAVCIFSREWVGQNAGNYSDAYLLENAELLYGAGGELCTKENVLEMAGIDQYTLGDRLVTVEEYENAGEKYVHTYFQFFRLD